jgi:flagella basal body P-ring formation protein FlgA
MRSAFAFMLAAVLGAAEPILPPQERIQQEAIAYAEAQAGSSAHGNYQFRVVQPPLLPPSKGQLSFEPSHLSKKELTGRFFAVFKIYADGRPAGMTRVDLEGKWSGRILKTRTALGRKAILEADVLEEVNFEGMPPAGALTEIPEGHRLRNPVGAGHTLTRMDLEPIPLVNAGDRVRLELVWGPLAITSEALARSYGPLGERIRLELPATRKTVFGVVTGPGTVRIDWGTGRR